MGQSGRIATIEFDCPDEWGERDERLLEPDQRRGVIFDLDGVLIDSFALHHEALEALASELGVTASEEFHRARFGTRTVDTLRAMLPEGLSDEEIARLVERKEAMFRELARGRLTSPPGALELVRSLKASGFQLAIGSSTLAENVAEVLEELGITWAFDAISTGDEVGAGKPEPDIFLLAAAKLGLPPGRCVVVEDAVPGVEAANRARCPVIAVTTSHPAERLGHATRVVASMAELTPDDFDALIFRGRGPGVQAAG